MTVPAVVLDGELQLGVRDVQEEPVPREPDNVPLPRFGQTGIDEDAYDPHLRVTVARVIARDAVSEQLVYDGRASARAGLEPSNAPADSAETRRPSTQPLVEGLRELKP
jgi:hypothetical protein